MAPVVYTGALQPKKKSELQEIAAALRISDQGTKDELQTRIKKHLDDHPDLEDHPAFGGLFGRRKRSVQPQSIPPSSSSDKLTSTRASGRRFAALDPIRESTPANDLRDVSMFLKHPITSVASTPDHQHAVDAITPSSLPPLPPSPAKSLIEHLPRPQNVGNVVRHIREHDLLLNGSNMLISLRSFLSNSRNIWSLTVVLEMLYILSVVIPWKVAQLSLSPKGNPSYSINFNYPPLSVFQTPAFWLVLLHWAIPSLFVPAFAGHLISFNPSMIASTSSPSTIAPFDPLTAAIIRLAAQVAYPFDTLDSKIGIVGVDVIGFKFRVLAASVSLAFAFAEAVSIAPQAFVNTFIPENRTAITEPPIHKAVEAEESVEDSEVD